MTCEVFSKGRYLGARGVIVIRVVGVLWVGKEQPEQRKVWSKKPRTCPPIDAFKAAGPAA